MATVKHAAPAATYTFSWPDAFGQLDSAIGIGNFTTLSGTASGATLKVDNTNLTGGGYLYGDFELTLGSLTALAGGYVGLYIVPSLDGSNFAPSGAAGALAGATVGPGEGYLSAVFPLYAATSVQLAYATNVPLPPLNFRVVLQNVSGATFAVKGQGNALKLSRHHIDVS